MNKIPNKGQDQQQILAQLKAFKGADLPWQDGKIFAYIYQTTPEAKAVAEAAYLSFLPENGLDPTAFPSLLHLEQQIIGQLAPLLGGNEEVKGNCTSGGTESVILAVKAARDYARAKYPDQKEFEILVPSTAHPCFYKAAHYLNIGIQAIDVDPQTQRLKVADMRAAISEKTILLVGSAPSYAHGVMDPIAELSDLALEKDLLLHVDACVGGMYLPFLRQLGHEVPPFGFELPGVTSISCDLHKFGYVPKGCSTILYRNKELRQHQIFSCSQWPGYTVVNPTVLSSKTGAPMAAAWAMFQYMGLEGYQNAVADCQAARDAVIAALEQLPSLQLIGQPDMSLLAFASKDEALSIFDLADQLNEKGWYVQVQLASPHSPAAIHLSISHFNCPHIPNFIADLEQTVAELMSSPVEGNELLAALDHSMLALLMEDFDPAMLGQFQELMGLESAEGGLPADMGAVNQLLNLLSAKQREDVLLAFMNELI